MLFPSFLEAAVSLVQGLTILVLAQFGHTLNNNHLTPITLKSNLLVSIIPHSIKLISSISRRVNTGLFDHT